MNPKTHYLLLGTTVLALFAASLSSRAALAHRYRFNEAPGTFTANDSAGTAHGTLIGTGDFTGTGQLALGGNDGYVDLPNGLISSLSKVTFETWVTWNGGARLDWQRVFDIGSQTGGEDGSGNGTTYLQMTPRAGSNGRLLFEGIDNLGGRTATQLFGNGPLPQGQQVHVVATYDPGANLAELYVDGERVATGNATIPLNVIPDVNVWLGRSNWPDPFLNGGLEEFRIYDVPLTALQVAINNAAGPEQIVTDPGALQSVSLTVDTAMLLGGVSPAALKANFANVANVNVTPVGGANYQSSNPAILTVTANGLVQAVGLGTASITASYQGQQDSKSITVTQVPAVLKHRYSFSEAPGSSTVEDLVGNDDGQALGTLEFTGDGKLNLPGGGWDTPAGYVNLPNGILSSLTNTTVETWVTWNGGPVWQRLFDIGSSVEGEDLQGTGQTFFMVVPLTGDSGRLRVQFFNGSAGTFIDYLPAMPSGQEVHLVVSYSYSARIAKLYLNGRLVAKAPADAPLNTLNDINCWLGKSQFRDEFFHGQFNEFRIYDGALTDLEVAVSAAAGPNQANVLNPGTLQSISLQATSPMILGGVGNFVALANFSVVSGVNVTALPQTSYRSLDTGIVIIGPNGTFEAVGVGTATVEVTYQGQTATAGVTVNQVAGLPVLPTVIHRYSFSESPGSTTVDDSVGNADGTVTGNGAVFGAGKLTLPGGAWDSGSAFVNLPNGLISGLSNATFEAWVTWNGGPDWQRIFDIGDNNAGEDLQGDGVSYIQLTPRAGSSGRLFFEWIDFPVGGPFVALNGPAPLTIGQATHVAVSYNVAANVSRLYVNGQRVDRTLLARTLGEINDINVWLGRSNWRDAYFNGEFDEFRIYNGAMLDSQAAASFAAGPNALPNFTPPPVVSARRDGVELVLTWPGADSGFSVWTSDEISPVHWTRLDVTITLVGGQYQARVPIDASRKFYQLAQ